MRRSVLAVAIAAATLSFGAGLHAQKTTQVHPGKDVDPYEGREWRTGADEATTLTTSRALKFGNLSVPAGTYTLYTIPTGGTWHLIVSKKTGQWGVPYPKGEDLGRVPMTLSKPAKAADQLTILIDDTQAGGTLHVDWGTTRASIPFTVG